MFYNRQIPSKLQHLESEEKLLLGPNFHDRNEFILFKAASSGKTTHIANRSFGNKWTSKQSQLCYSILKILTREYAPFSCCVDTRCCYSRYRSVLHQMLFLVYIWHWTSNLSLPKELRQKYKKTKQNTAIIQSSNPESQFLHWNTWISSLLLVVRYTFFQTVFYECKWLQSLYSFITTRLHQILNFVCFSVHITDR